MKCIGTFLFLLSFLLKGWCSKQSAFEFYSNPIDLPYDESLQVMIEKTFTYPKKQKPSNLTK